LQFVVASDALPVIVLIVVVVVVVVVGKNGYRSNGIGGDRGGRV
jgi:hypothetical protein